MISSITLEDFRNFQHVQILPKMINVISGDRASGKTSLLEAIGFTDSNDSEFLSIMMSRRYDPSKPFNVRQLVEHCFFAHNKTLESFKVKVEFTTANTRIFQIWKTQEDFARVLDSKILKASPYIFIYDSIDPKQVTPRCIPFEKVEKVYDDLMKRPREWPMNYIGAFTTVAPNQMHVLFSHLRKDPLLATILQSYVNASREISRVEYGKTDILIKLENNKQPIPLVCCSEAVIRILTIVFSSLCCRRPYILLDDIGHGLSETECEWLVETLVLIAMNRRLQIFVTTRDPLLHLKFQHYLREKQYRMLHVNLDHLQTPTARRASQGSLPYVVGEAHAR